MGIVYVGQSGGVLPARLDWGVWGGYVWVRGAGMAVS
jgi:hypothetical protein